MHITTALHVIARPFWGLLIWAGLVLSSITPAAAHGTEIDLTDVQALEIVARFDNGEPMAEAQVVVYAPDDAATPWLTGVADETGRFIFTPDYARPGQWAIQVRTAGHGDWVYATLDDRGSAEIVADSGGFTTAQIILMSAAGIWGFIGTALYFARTKSSEQKSEDSSAVVV